MNVLKGKRGPAPTVDDDGLQSFEGQKRRPEDVLALLSSRNSKYSKLFTFKINSKGVCVAECMCKAQLSVANLLTTSWRAHAPTGKCTSCKKRDRDALDSDSDSDKDEPRHKTQKITQFLVSKSNMEAAKEELMKVIITANLPFKLVDWPDKLRKSALKVALRHGSSLSAGFTVEGVASMVARRTFWAEKAQPHVPILSAAAIRLLSLHVTTAAAERNWSAWGNTFTSARAALGLDRAQKMIFIKENMESDASANSTDALVALSHILDE